MSDFISELRREVVDAHGRHHRRGRLQRAARAMRPRVWRPAAVLAAVAVAAALVGAVVAVRYLAAPERPASRPQIVAVIAIGGTPVSAAFGGGSLWVTDFTGSVVRVDPRGRRVLARIKVRAQPGSIAAGAGSVWVRTRDASGPAGGPLGSHLLHIDPRTNRVLARVALGGGSALALGAHAVWAARRFTMPEGIEQIDPTTGAPSGRMPLRNVDGIAVARAAVWVIQHDGTVLEVDAATGRIARRWPQLAPSSAGGSSQHALAADTDGAWVLSTVKAAILRIADGRAVPADPDRPIYSATPGTGARRPVDHVRRRLVAPQPHHPDRPGHRQHHRDARPRPPAAKRAGRNRRRPLCRHHRGQDPADPLLTGAAQSRRARHLANSGPREAMTTASVVIRDTPRRQDTTRRPPPRRRANS